MENILNRIITERRVNVDAKKQVVPIEFLQQSTYFKKPATSLVKQLLNPNGSGIIAEFKRASPSKGNININANIVEILQQYQQAGAAGISILTEPNFFKGRDEDIIDNRDLVKLPVLRKDFVVDEYQLYEAKSFGADVVLLIAAALTPKQTQQLASTAKKIGLEVLLEVHNTEEIQYVCNEVDIVGVNNRNLKTFEISLQTSVELIDYLPNNKVVITESGIANKNDILSLKQIGYQGFLIGESLMKNLGDLDTMF